MEGFANKGLGSAHINPSFVCLKFRIWPLALLMPCSRAERVIGQGDEDVLNFHY